MQTKLHQWATADPGRSFDDLYNLAYDPAFLTVAWHRVRGERVHEPVESTAKHLVRWVPALGRLPVGLRDGLKARRFVPQRVREKTIPKASGRVRSLGIPTAAHRVVQASLNLVLKTETIPLGVTMPGSQPTHAEASRYVGIRVGMGSLFRG